MIKTITNWKDGQAFESRQDQHRIVTDGTKTTGFSPKALLLAGLAGCSGIDVVEILEKKRIAFSGLIIETTAHQTDDHPKVFRDVTLLYRVKTAVENENKVRKAIELSLEKYCGVSAMLKKNSPVDYELVIE